MSRPTVACGLCGKKTWAAGGFCSRCVHRARSGGQVHPQLGLYGGRWVGRGGIQVWVTEGRPLPPVVAVRNNGARGRDVSRPPSGAPTPLLRGLADRVKDTTD